MLAKPLRNMSRRSRTILITTFGLSTVLALGLWDIHHEDQLALRQLMQEHHLLAESISADFDDYGRGSSLSPDSFRPEHDLGFEVLLLSHKQGQYLTSQHRWVRLPELAQAYERGALGSILSREAAGALGLPRRTAIVGFTPVHDNLDHIQAIAVVSSAEAERDRSRREQWRSVLSIVLASGLILLVGVGTLRRQKRELDLDRQRALHKLERARDTELARANRMASIAALSSGIAHEIATPLGVIMGRIEQLQTALQGQERPSRSVASIAVQVHRIDKIMRGFLAFARGDAPLLTHRPVNEIGRNVVHLVEYSFALADVILDFRPCPYESLNVACEPALFEQALIGMLVNALEASKPRQTVTFLVEYDDNHVFYRICDEGPGISESVVARVTDPFFTTKSGTGGTGLGLAIAKEILIHHRGTMTFDRQHTTEGRSQTGTRVTVRLPRSGLNDLECTT